MKLIIPLFCIHITSMALAGWLPISKNEILSESNKYDKLTDQDLSTLWGGFQRAFDIYLLKGNVVDLKSDRFKTKKLPTYISTKNNKAPLVFFFPGIFGTHEGKITPKIISDLESLNLHVVVIPNFLSHIYVKQEPLYNMEDISEDFQITYDIFEKSIQKIGTENISSIHLMGESLGGLVAAAIMAIDHDSQSPLLNEISTTTLFWPPLDLNYSLKSFDKKIEKSRNADLSCNYFIQSANLIYHMFFQKMPEGLSQTESKCFKAYLYHKVFLQAAIKSLKETKKEIPQNEDLNLSKIFKIYRPKLSAKMQKEKFAETTLHYWLKKANAYSDKRIKIISSSNDFINDNKNWTKISQQFTNNDTLITLNWGGHCGPLAMSIWPRIFDQEIIFSKK